MTDSSFSSPAPIAPATVAVEHYPDMTFTSTNIVAKGDDEYDITGKLTIKDTTKNVTFKAEFEGKAVDPWGNDVVGFSARGKLAKSTLFSL